MLFNIKTKQNNIKTPILLRKNLIYFIFLAVLVFGSQTSSIQAQSGVEVLNQDVQYTFAEEINFQLDFISEAEVTGINLVLQVPGYPSFVGEVLLYSSGQTRFVYDLTQRPLPAFSNIRYSYHITLANEEVIETPEYSFTYLDNRYNWQELIQDPFRIYWYEGELTLAQEVLDAAVLGQEQILYLLQQPKDNQLISIFIYNSENELQSTLASIGQSWVGGHADPTLGSVVVSLPPGVNQSLEIQRLIPHEITHITLYRFMGTEYEYLPAWFKEGLASMMEVYSLPEYALTLERASKEGGFIPMAHLCVAFPTDPELALLSYAQSESFLNYIQQEYGTQGLQAMILAYDQGVSCERGVEVGLGTTLVSLEKEWKRDTFSRDIFLTYIYILGGILLVLIISLGIFIYSKVKDVPVESEWESNE